LNDATLIGAAVCVGQTLAAEPHLIHLMVGASELASRRNRDADVLRAVAGAVVESIALDATSRGGGGVRLLLDMAHVRAFDMFALGANRTRYALMGRHVTARSRWVRAVAVLAALDAFSSKTDCIIDDAVSIVSTFGANGRGLIGGLNGAFGGQLGAIAAVGARAVASLTENRITHRAVIIDAIWRIRATIIGCRRGCAFDATSSQHGSRVRIFA
jgi:hypothetical protein